MKKINAILFGALLLGAANCTLLADVENVEECIPQSLTESDVAALSEAGQAAVAALGESGVDVACIDEVEKWQHLEKHFASDLNKLKLYQKVGKGLKASASYITLLFTGPVTFLGIVVCGSRIAGLLQQWGWKDEQIKDIIYAGAFAVTSPVICLMLNKLLQSIGKKLENKEGRCKQLLVDFVTKWNQNKTQTPTVLQPLFQNLSEELKANGKFTKTDNAAAQKIVESIVAASLIVSSVN